jgi:membrane-bound inhibitor of C-type lysozyme
VRRAGLAAALLLLAACGQKAPEAKPAEPAPAAAPPSLAKASRTVAYTCDKDLPVTAIYGTDAKGQPDLALIIRGQDFRLTPSVAASGARYTTQYGLEPGLGLAWWEKGDEALLQQAPFKQIDDPAVAQTVRTCRVKTDKPAEAAPAK